MFKLRLLSLLLVPILGILGCSRSAHDNIKGTVAIAEQLAGTKTSESTNVVGAEEVKADNGKASDDDEGIPGYLVDPTQIQVSNERDGDHRFEAPAGTILSNHGKQIYLVAWELRLEAINPESGVLIEGSSQTAMRKVSAPIAADGSFNFEVPSHSPNNGLVVSIEYTAEPTVLDFVVEERNTFAAFALAEEGQPSGGYGGGGGPGPGFNDADHDAIGLVASSPALLDGFGVDLGADLAPQLFDGPVPGAANNN